jgi:hypothetical protein
VAHVTSGADIGAAGNHHGPLIWSTIAHTLSARFAHHCPVAMDNQPNTKRLEQELTGYEYHTLPSLLDELGPCPQSCCLEHQTYY